MIELRTFCHGGEGTKKFLTTKNHSWDMLYQKINAKKRHPTMGILYIFQACLLSY